MYTMWAEEDILIGFDWEHAVVATSQLQSIPCFTYFTLIGSIIYKINIMLFLRRFETSDWDYKLIRKLLSEVLNQVRSEVIFS